MSVLATTRAWATPRVLGLGAAALVVLVFAGANAHFIAVAFSSRPDCVLQPTKEGATIHIAAKPSC